MKIAEINTTESREAIGEISKSKSSFFEKKKKKVKKLKKGKLKKVKKALKAKKKKSKKERKQKSPISGIKERISLQML